MRELIDELKAERDDLERRLAASEARAQEAARTMYRRGYLAGYSAGRRGAEARGPYASTKAVIGG